MTYERVTYPTGFAFDPETGEKRDLTPEERSFRAPATALTAKRRP